MNCMEPLAHLPHTGVLHTLASRFESGNHEPLRRLQKDALHPRGEAQPGRIEPIITLIIYFSPSTAEPARKRSLIPFAFQSCNIYSKPEPLTVNILSEEQSWL